MKNFAYLIAGVTAAIAYFLIQQQGSREPSKSQRSSAASEPVEHLAHELQEAWADHHTQV